MKSLIFSLFSLGLFGLIGNCARKPANNFDFPQDNHDKYFSSLEMLKEGYGVVDKHGGNGKGFDTLSYLLALRKLNDRYNLDGFNSLIDSMRYHNYINSRKAKSEQRKWLTQCEEELFFQDLRIWRLSMNHPALVVDSLQIETFSPQNHCQSEVKTLNLARLEYLEQGTVNLARKRLSEINHRLNSREEKGRNSLFTLKARYSSILSIELYNRIHWPLYSPMKKVQYKKQQKQLDSLASLLHILHANYSTQKQAVDMAINVKIYMGRYKEAWALEKYGEEFLSRWETFQRRAGVLYFLQNNPEFRSEFSNFEADCLVDSEVRDSVYAADFQGAVLSEIFPLYPRCNSYDIENRLFQNVFRLLESEHKEIIQEEWLNNLNSYRRKRVLYFKENQWLQFLYPVHKSKAKECKAVQFLNKMIEQGNIH
jgi:hypothetical protein